MKFVKNVFKNLYEFVDSHPQWGLIIIIAVFAGSFALLYDFGKDVGKFIYFIMEK